MSEERFRQGDKVSLTGIATPLENGMAEINGTYGNGIKWTVTLPAKEVQSASSDGHATITGQVERVSTHHFVQNDFSNAVTVRVRFGTHQYVSVPQEIVKKVENIVVSRVP